MKTQRVLPYVAVVGVACGVAGCGKAGEKAGDKAAEAALRREGHTNVSVSTSHDRVSVKSDQGEYVVGQSVPLPADFPKDVFVDPGGTVQMAMKTPQGFMLTLQTRQTMEQVASAYEAGLNAQGWTQETSWATGELRSWKYTKDRRNISLTLVKSEEGTGVQMVVGDR